MTPGFVRRWTIAATLGETAGFAVPALVGGLLTLLGTPGALVYPVMIVAGACEGALLGLGQWIGFGPGVVPRREWIAATSGGAAVAWSIGMLPSTLGGIDFDAPLVPVMVGLGALVLLLSIPTAQWVVLTRTLPSSSATRNPIWRSWIPVNAGAWAVGLCWTVVPSPFIDEQTSGGVILAVYIGAGVLMAATVAALTAAAARRIAHASMGENAATPTPMQTKTQA